MTVPLKNATAALLILLNLAVAVAPHIGHRDEGFTVGATAELRSHTCGANEIHKDIKDHSDCLLCSRSTNFVAFVVYGFVSNDDHGLFFSLPANVSVYCIDFSSSLHLRGPPAVSA